MTQGFPPGQPGYPAPPQGGYPQQGGYAPPFPTRRDSARGWLVLLFLVGLLPTVFTHFFNLFWSLSGADMSWYDMFYVDYWGPYTVTWAINTVRLVCEVSAVAVLFRSNAARWVLAASSAVMILNAVAGMVVSAMFSGSEWGLFEIFYVPILVVAFLPPVNRALRKTPQVGYPQQQPPQPVQQSMPQQPPQQPQPGYGYPPQQYPQQQWQQGPPR